MLVPKGSDCELVTGRAHRHLAHSMFHIVLSDYKLKPGRYELKKLLQVKLVQANLLFPLLLPDVGEGVPEHCIDRGGNDVHS